MVTGKKVKDKNFWYVELHWPFSATLSYVHAQTVGSVLKRTSHGLLLKNVWTLGYRWAVSCCEVSRMHLRTFCLSSPKAQIYSVMYMHQQQNGSLKYWKQKKSNARTGSSEQVRFSTPPGSWGFLRAKRNKGLSGAEGVFWRYCWNKDRLLVRIKTFWHKNFEPKK